MHLLLKGTIPIPKHFKVFRLGWIVVKEALCLGRM